MGNQVSQFDVFVYHEDDIVFKHAHLNGWLNETLKLHKILPANGVKDFNIGYVILLFDQINYSIVKLLIIIF